jgi:hypothetical protein
MIVPPQSNRFFGIPRNNHPSLVTSASRLARGGHPHLRAQTPSGVQPETLRFVAPNGLLAVLPDFLAGDSEIAVSGIKSLESRRT